MPGESGLKVEKEKRPDPVWGHMTSVAHAASMYPRQSRIPGSRSCVSIPSVSRTLRYGSCREGYAEGMGRSVRQTMARKQIEGKQEKQKQMQ